MRILEERAAKGVLADCKEIFEGPMVKAVVDVGREKLAIDAAMHADLEKLLLDDGSSQDDLWGINLWYEDEGEDFIEYDSMINVRPRQGNRSRDVEDEKMRQKIREVVAKWM